jgi:hypothetical protein
MKEWLKAIPGALYDVAVQAIRNYPQAAFWVLVGSLGLGGIGWVH